MLESKRNGSKDFWNLIKKITKREVPSKKIGPIKNKEGRLLYEDHEKADEMNHYFSTTGEKLAFSHQHISEKSLSYIYRELLLQ